MKKTETSYAIRSSKKKELEAAGFDQFEIDVFMTELQHEVKRLLKKGKK